MTKSKKTYAPALLCLAVMGLAGCGGGGGGSTSSSDLSPTGGSAAPTPATTTTPTTPTSSAGSSNGCFNLDLGYTAGTTTNISYTSQGTIGGIATPPSASIAESVIDGNVTLEGKTVIMGTTKHTGFDPTGKKSSETLVKGYSVRSGPAEMTTLRVDTNTTGFLQDNTTVVTNGTSIFNPGLVDTSPGMALGSVTEQSQKGTRTTTISPPGSTTTENFDSTNVMRFAAVETITIPAGTYTACRFEQWDKTNPSSTVTFWFAYGVGLVIKSETKNPGGVSVQQATSITVNGKKL